MRKSGYASQASRLTPTPLIDVRQERPVPPQRLTDEGKALWRELVEGKRAGWFNGSETTLESFVVVTLVCRKLEAALLGGEAEIGARFEKVSRLHRQAVQQAAMLARGLRLLPSTNHPKRTPPDSPQPLPHQRGHLHTVPNDDDCRDHNGERSFAALRERAFSSSERPPPPPADKSADGTLKATGGAADVATLRGTGR
jgi:hypothetical protein